MPIATGGPTGSTSGVSFSGCKQPTGLSPVLYLSIRFGRPDSVPDSRSLSSHGSFAPPAEYSRELVCCVPAGGRRSFIHPGITAGFEKVYSVARWPNWNLFGLWGYHHDLHNLWWTHVGFEPLRLRAREKCYRYTTWPIK